MAAGVTDRVWKIEDILGPDGPGAGVTMKLGHYPTAPPWPRCRQVHSRAEPLVAKLH
jgi:hypothetical protein